MYSCIHGHNPNTLSNLIIRNLSIFDLFVNWCIKNITNYPTNALNDSNITLISSIRAEITNGLTPDSPHHL